MRKIAIVMVILIAANSVMVMAQSRMPDNFVRIAGGAFTMGSPANEPGRDSGEVQRQVTVSAFHMSRHPVTQREYEEIMGTNPSYFKGPNLPVEKVSWFDAIDLVLYPSSLTALL